MKKTCVFTDPHGYKPLRDIVFEAIRGAIITGELKPGERLMEEHLAEAMGVSRTPVREALQRLELEGLVVIAPRKGAYVADMSLQDVIDVFQVQAALEGLAARLAAKRITGEEMDRLTALSDKMAEYIDTGDDRGIVDIDLQFHEVLFTASRNNRLSTITNQLNDKLYNLRVISLSSIERACEAMTEHKSILEALERRSSDDAYDMTVSHIGSAGTGIIDILQGEGYK